MNCSNCGFSLKEGDKFCSCCGTPISNQDAQSLEKQTGELGIGEQATVQQNPMEYNHINNMQQVNQSYGQPMNQNYGQPMNQNYGQPMNQNYGQPMDQNYINYNNQSSERSGGSAGLVVGIIALVAVFAVVMFLGARFLLSSADEKKDKDDRKTTVTKEKEEEIITNKVTFKDFTFEVPNDITFEQGYSSLNLYDVNNEWAALIEIEPGYFSQLKFNKSGVVESIQSVGYTVNKNEIKQVLEKEFIILEVNDVSGDAIIGICEARDGYFMAITVQNTEGTLDYDLFEKVVEVVKTGKYSETSLKAESKKNIDMDKLKDLAKKKKKK